MVIVHEDKHGKCARCGIFSILEEHHIYRRTNNAIEVVKLCHDCHMWVHSHIKEAREIGLYKSFDGIYRKKESNPRKWVIKKRGKEVNEIIDQKG